MDIWSNSGTFYVDDFCSEEIICNDGCVLSPVPVCLNGEEVDPCFASCEGYTEHEWEEGPCEEEDCCLECFDYLFDDDDVNRCYLFNNYCEEQNELFDGELIYSWSILPALTPTVDFGGYVNGTNGNSPNPIYDFGAVSYTHLTLPTTPYV